jgi:plasmid maintenance system antidote protein VapI
MSIAEFMEWRKGAGDSSLTQQLLAAIAATDESLADIAEGAGVATPILQRFVNGERGVTLETAGKIAAYLGLGLMPTASAES